jgi:DNA polymerase-4
MGFDPIWSVAPNKLIAKVATRMVKPDGEYVIGAGEEQDFLNPVPLHLIPGIEREDLKRFREFNLTRAGHVARLSMGQLDIMFGARSGSLYHAVRGMDPSPVLPVGQMPPVVVADHEFATDTNPVAVVHGALYGLGEQVGADLRKRRLTTRRIKVFLDYSDGRQVARQAVAHPATANDVRLFVLAKRVLERAWTRRAGIRHLRLICDRLTYPPAQMALFAPDEKENQMNDSLMLTLDTIRRRFGFNAIRVGKTLFQ